MTPLILLIIKAIISCIIFLTILVICSFIEYLVTDSYHLTFKEFFINDSLIGIVFVHLSIIILVILGIVILFTIIFFIYNLIPL